MRINTINDLCVPPWAELLRSLWVAAKSGSSGELAAAWNRETGRPAREMTSRSWVEQANHIALHTGGIIRGGIWS